MSKRAEQLAAEALGTVFEYDPGDPKSHVLIAKIAGIIRVYGKEVRARDGEACKGIAGVAVMRFDGPCPYEIADAKMDAALSCAAAISREPLP